MSYAVTDEMIAEHEARVKKNVLYYALVEYKNKLLKQIEKEKKQAEKTSQKLKEVLASNPTKAQRTSASAKNVTKWEYVRELELQLQLIDELIEENK